MDMKLGHVARLAQDAVGTTLPEAAESVRRIIAQLSEEEVEHFAKSMP